MVTDSVGGDATCVWWRRGGEIELECEMMVINVDEGEFALSDGNAGTGLREHLGVPDVRGVNG